MSSAAPSCPITGLLPIDTDFDARWPGLALITGGCDFPFAFGVRTGAAPFVGATAGAAGAELDSWSRELRMPELALSCLMIFLISRNSPVALFKVCGQLAQRRRAGQRKTCGFQVGVVTPSLRISRTLQGREFMAPRNRSNDDLAGHQEVDIGAVEAATLLVPFRLRPVYLGGIHAFRNLRAR